LKDEYCTAAYKTVELDALLNDAAVQHREVDGFESEMFMSYFNKIEKLQGGYPSGFRMAREANFKPRLLLFHAVDYKHIELTEVTFSKQAIDSDDVFVLDMGKTVYQWNGNGANKDERFQASLYLRHLEDERLGRCQALVVDEYDKEGTAELFSHLPDYPILEHKTEQEVGRKAIYRLSDGTGKLEVTLVCENRLPRSALTHDDAYFIDTGRSLFVYIGEGCSQNEKQNALSYANVNTLFPADLRQ
jgi:gelsolin